MDALKKLFPLSFKKMETLAALIIGILIYVIAGAVAGVVIAILSAIPVVNLVTGIVGGLVGLYCFVGIVLQILVYVDVLKD